MRRNPELAATGDVGRLKAATTVGPAKGTLMNSIIYLVGLVVVVLFILSLLGLR